MVISRELGLGSRYGKDNLFDVKLCSVRRIYEMISYEDSVIYLSVDRVTRLERQCDTW